MKVGDQVVFFHNGYRTGRFLGIVENVKSSHRDFGLYKIQPNFLCRKEVLVRPEEIKPLELTEEAAS